MVYGHAVDLLSSREDSNLKEAERREGIVW
jgi:hypothetical protein